MMESLCELLPPPPAQPRREGSVCPAGPGGGNPALPVVFEIESSTTSLHSQGEDAFFTELVLDGNSPLRVDPGSAGCVVPVESIDAENAQRDAPAKYQSEVLLPSPKSPGENEIPKTHDESCDIRGNPKCEHSGNPCGETGENVCIGEKTKDDSHAIQKPENEQSARQVMPKSESHGVKLEPQDVNPIVHLKSDFKHSFLRTKEGDKSREEAEGSPPGIPGHPGEDPRSPIESPGRHPGILMSPQDENSLFREKHENTHSAVTSELRDTCSLMESRSDDDPVAAELWGASCAVSVEPREQDSHLVLGGSQGFALADTQGENSDMPAQSHGENSDMPAQSHGENSDMPAQSHGENSDMPTESLGQNWNRLADSPGKILDTLVQSQCENLGGSVDLQGKNLDVPVQSQGKNVDASVELQGEILDIPVKLQDEILDTLAELQCENLDISIELQCENLDVPVELLSKKSAVPTETRCENSSHLVDLRKETATFVPDFRAFHDTSAKLERQADEQSDGLKGRQPGNSPAPTGSAFGQTASDSADPHAGSRRVPGKTEGGNCCSPGRLQSRDSTVPGGSLGEAASGASCPEPATPAVQAELLAVPADTGGTPPEILAVPADTGGTPPEILAVPADTGGTPPEILAVPADTGGTPPEILAVPADTGGTPPEILAVPADTGGTPPEILAVPADTEGTPPEILAIPAETGAIPPEVPAIPAETGAIPPEVPAIPAGTGAIPPEVPAIPAGTGAIPPEVPAIPAKTGAIPPEVPAIPAETGAIPPEVPAIPAETGAIPPEVPAIPAETGGTPAETPAVPVEGTVILVESPAIPAETPAISVKTAGVPAAATATPSQASPHSPSTPGETLAVSATSSQTPSASAAAVTADTLGAPAETSEETSDVLLSLSEVSNAPQYTQSAKSAAPDSTQPEKSPVPINALSEDSAASRSSVQAAPDNSVQAAPDNSVQAASYNSVQAAPDSNVQAAPHNSVQAAPNSSVQAAPHSSVQAAPNSSVQAASHSSAQAASHSRVQAAPDNSVQAGSNSSVQRGPSGESAAAVGEEEDDEEEGEDSPPEWDGEETPARPESPHSWMQGAFRRLLVTAMDEYFPYRLRHMDHPVVRAYSLLDAGLARQKQAGQHPHQHQHHQHQHHQHQHQHQQHHQHQHQHPHQHHQQQQHPHQPQHHQHHQQRQQRQRQQQEAGESTLVGWCRGVLEREGLADMDQVVGEGTLRGVYLLGVACQLGNCPVVKLLLDAGADVNPSSDTVGETPLHVAAFHGHQGAVRLLLERGARVDAQCASSFSALQLALENGHTDCALLLVRAGASVNALTPSFHGAPLPSLVLTLLLQASGRAWDSHHLVFRLYQRLCEPSFLVMPALKTHRCSRWRACVADEVLRAGVLPSCYPASPQDVAFLLLHSDACRLVLRKLACIGFRLPLPAWACRGDPGGEEEGELLGGGAQGGVQGEDEPPECREVLEFLRRQRASPACLQHQCRLLIRQTLLQRRRFPVHLDRMADALPLPEALRDFLKFQARGVADFYIPD